MAALLVSFESFTGHHIIQIAAIEQQLYPNYPLSYGDLVAQLGKGARGWVVKSEGRVIAYTLVSLSESVAHLLKLSVLPEYRSKGLGKKLLDRVRELAGHSGASELKLEVAERNTTAIRFYEKLGMVRQGVLPGYYPAQGGREDAVQMMTRLINPTQE